jgi:peroxiredoxin
MCVVLALAAASCGNGASDAKEQKGPAVKTASTADRTASEAYAQIKKDATDLQMKATTQQLMEQAMNETAQKLEKFIAAYPGTYEATDATLQLALIQSALSNFEAAVPNLQAFVRTGDETDERVGYAHFYLAEAYRNLDRFDEAQTEYKVFVDKYSHLNPRFVQTATAALNDIPSQRRLAVGSDPIPFEVKDINGKRLSLDAYKGKVVLLDFWATWCMPCKVEMPNVVRIHKRFNKDGFEIIGISLDSNRDALENFIKTNEMSWPQYFDGKGWQNGLAEQYRVRAIPATYLIDKKGKIRYRSLRGADLESAVERLLAES